MHTESVPVLTGTDRPGPSRRALLTRGAALTLGAAATTGLLTVPAAPARADAALDNWRFCVNCFVLFQQFSRDGSTCPRTGGAHQEAGWTFRLAYNFASGGTGEDGTTQGNWRMCGKCAVLYWANSTSQHCPAGGAHNYFDPALSPWQFLMAHDIGQPAWTQDQWRFCFKCSAMFFNGYAYKGEYGFCPYDYTYGHTAAGYDFAIPVSNYNS